MQRPWTREPDFSSPRGSQAGEAFAGPTEAYQGPGHRDLGRPGSLMHDCPRHSRDDGLGGNNPQNRLFRAARSEKQSPREIVPPRKFRDTDSGAPKNRLFWTKKICFQLLKSVKGDCSASRDCFLNLAEIVKFPVKFLRLFPPGENDCFGFKKSVFSS